MKFKEFVLKNKWWFLGILVVLVLGVTSIFLWQSTRPVATVNGKAITKAQYTKESENYTQMAEFMNNSDYSKPTAIRDALVERKLIDIAAIKYEISISDEEIKEEVSAQEELFKDKNVDYKEAYATAYGLDNDELATTLKYKLLKDKLADKIIKRKEGRLIYTRFNSGNGVEELLNIKTEELESNADSIIKSWKSKLDAGMSFDELYKTIQQENKYPAYYGDTFKHDVSRDKVPGEDEAILATDVGKYSEIAKTKTYLAIYFIDSGSNGEYDKWEDFIKDYSNKYVKYPLISYKDLSTIKVGMTAVKSRVERLTHDVFGFKIALAGCNSCSGCSGAKVKGTVKDTLGNALSGIAMSGTSNSSDFCSGSTSSSKVAYCGYRTDSDSTSSTGYYAMGDSDGNSCRFNCAGGTVAVKAAHSRYTDQTKTVTVTNGSTKDVDFTLTPVKHRLTVVVNGTGTGKVTSPSGGITCDKGESATSADCTADYTYNVASGNVYTTLTATPGSTSLFAGWSGGGCSGTGTCQPNVDNDVTVYATMNLKPVLNATCGAFTAPATVNKGTAFSASLTMNNTGTNNGGSASWTTAAGHKLGSQTAQDNTRWGFSRVALPATTAVGNSATFAINATAPNTVGTYDFDWKMLQESVTWFGATCTKRITVVEVIPVTPSCTLTATPNPASSVGGAVTLNYTTTNATSAIWTGSKSGAVSPIASGTSSGSGGNTYGMTVTSSTGNTSTCAVAVSNPGVTSYTITPTADTGCSINPSTVQTVVRGANSNSFTGSASAGYKFDGFSVDGSSSMTASPYTFTNVQSAHTIRARCSVATPVTPVITLVSPKGSPLPTDEVIVDTNNIDLTAEFSIPGYKAGTGGTARMRMVFTENVAGAEAITVTSSSVAIGSNGKVSFTIPTKQKKLDGSDYLLQDGRHYTWMAAGNVDGGSPTDSSGNSILTSEVSTVQWFFTYRAPVVACIVSPVTGDKPLTVGISLTSVISGATYTIDMGDGVTIKDVLGSDLPYYFTYSKVGDYIVSIGSKDLGTGVVSPVCSSQISVTGKTDGDNDEVTP